MCVDDKSGTGRRIICGRGKEYEEKTEYCYSGHLCGSDSTSWLHCHQGMGRATAIESMVNIRTGLDLSGVISITYQMKTENPSQKDIEDTIYKLQQRVF